MFGDSLTAGYGLSPSQSYPALIQKKLDDAGYNYEVVNAGVSGETSAGGLRRIDQALDDGAAVVVVALGGNDGLRGLPVAELQKNLSGIVARAQGAGATVILAGMHAPPSLGIEYSNRFSRVYQDVADEYDVELIPFLLEGVAGELQYNQSDGIHPNAAGARVVAETVWSHLEPVLAEQ
jgi:acyl-CoA thioesterase-1